MTSVPLFKIKDLTYPERVEANEAATLALLVVCLDLLRSNYQLCNLVAHLQPNSNVRDQLPRLKAHSKTVQDLIVQLELKDMPF